MNDQDADDLRFRILQLLDGELGQEEVAQLDAELRNDPQARRLYLEFAQLHNALESRSVSRAQIGRAPLFSVEKLLARQRRSSVTKALLAAAAVLTVTFISLWLMVAERRTTSLASFEVAAQSVFTLTHPGDDHAPTENILRAGSRLRVTTGVVEGKFASGVRFVAEAPCDFRVETEDRIALAEGVTWFEVPANAVGFAVETQKIHVVDLGTRFGVVALRDKDHEIHVTKGMVEASPRTKDHAKHKIVIKAGQARRLDASGMLVQIPVDSSRFITSMPNAPMVRNPGFENLENFAGRRSPVGYGPISSWGTSGDAVGSGGLDIPFLTSPAHGGEKVAFIQAKGAIAQSVSGFDPTKTYTVTYFVNERGYSLDGISQPATRTSVTLDLGTSFYEHPGLITKTDAFRRIVSGPLHVFGPTANIEIRGHQAGSVDSTLLIDSVSISRAVPLIPDGGFENPPLPPSTFKQANGTGGGTLSGSAWTFSNLGGITANRSAFEPPPAAEGSQAAILQIGDSGIETIVKGFEPGVTYRLRLEAAGRTGGASALRVTLGGMPLRFQDSESLLPSVGNYQSFASADFQAASDTLPLLLHASGAGTTFLDDLRFEFVSEAAEAR